MHIRAPHAQIRDDGEFSVRLNAAGKAPFAVIDLSGDDTTALTIGSTADCDRLIRAFTLAKKALMLHEAVNAGVATEDDETSQPVSVCPAVTPRGEHGEWMCTLPLGHAGHHEAHGAATVRVWEDGGPGFIMAAGTDAS